MEGTEKQIAWAENIRTEQLKKLEDSLARDKAVGPHYLSPEDELQYKFAIHIYSTEKSAPWIIDNRGLDPQGLLTQISYRWGKGKSLQQKQDEMAAFAKKGD